MAETDGPSDLFPDAQPARGHAQQQVEDLFRPVEVPDEGRVDELSYDTSTLPAMWLFDEPTRRKLVAYALETLATAGDSEDIQYLSKTQLGEEAGAHRQSISTHIGDMCELGIFEMTGEKRMRYRPNVDSEVLPVVHVLNERLADLNIDVNS